MVQMGLVRKTEILLSASLLYALCLTPRPTSTAQVPNKRAWRASYALRVPANESSPISLIVLAPVERVETKYNDDALRFQRGISFDFRLE